MGKSLRWKPVTARSNAACPGGRLAWQRAVAWSGGRGASPRHHRHRARHLRRRRQRSLRLREPGRPDGARRAPRRAAVRPRHALAVPRVEFLAAGLSARRRRLHRSHLSARAAAGHGGVSAREGTRRGVLCRAAARRARRADDRRAWAPGFTARSPGALAAVLLASSPSVLYQVLQPVSDVPAMAWWTASLAMAMQGGPGGIARRCSREPPRPWRS